MGRICTTIPHDAAFAPHCGNLDRLLTARPDSGFLRGVIDEARGRAVGGRGQAAAMESFTRGLWRALKPTLMPDPRRPGWSERYLLQACRATVARLAADPQSEPMAVRTLFSSARSLIRAHEQLRASELIERHLARARAHFERQRSAQGLDGTPRCAALNRKGRPCGREPMWGTAFCVSHTAR
jgi:hypothetical protein